MITCMKPFFKSKFVIPTFSVFFLAGCSSMSSLFEKSCNKEAAYYHGKSDSKILEEMASSPKNCVLTKKYSQADYSKDYELGFQKGLSEFCNRDFAYNHGKSDFNTNSQNKWDDYLNIYAFLKNRVKSDGCYISKKYSIDEYKKDYLKGYSDADQNKKQLARLEKERLENLARLERDRLDRESCNEDKAFNGGSADGKSSKSGTPSLRNDVCLSSKYFSHENYKKTYISGFVKEFCSTKKITEKAVKDAEDLSAKTSSSYFTICNNSDFYKSYVAQYDKALNDVCSPVNMTQLGAKFARKGKGLSQGLEAIKVCPNSTSVVSNFKTSYDSEKQLMLKEENLRLERERAAREELARQESLRLERERAYREDRARQESLRLERERLEMAKQNHARDEQRRKENTCVSYSEYSCREKTVNSACQKINSLVGTCVITGLINNEPRCNCQ